MPNLGFTICHLASFFPLGDVTIYAKTTVTRPRNIKVTPMREKLTVTVPKGKEAGILEAFFIYTDWFYDTSDFSTAR